MNSDALHPMSDTPPNDLFATIAGHGPTSNRRDGLAENPASAKPAGPLLNEPLADAGFATLPRIDDASSLEPELARLREWAKPFLEHHAPPMPAGTRERIAVDHFDWKLVEPAEENGFAEALQGGGSGWQRVAIPHYGPPTGRALAWYRSTVEVPAAWLAQGRTVWLCFDGADYHARVSVNGRGVGEHEGFFSRFEFDITRSVKAGPNQLFIELRNDGICMGHQGEPEGDKLYAATGMGWDEPESGWHHCPPGMGIHRPLRIESRPEVFLHDVWARPLFDRNAVEVRAEVHNCLYQNLPVGLEITVHGSNFIAPLLGQAVAETPDAGPGVTFYQAELPLSEIRHWSPEAPWLYQAQVTLKRGGAAVDQMATDFGMRCFVVDETTTPKGRLYLNHKPIRLRGANTMGFEQQRVANSDLDGLVEDLLLAKACHMNFLRFTQRPVEREVYQLCDRLGVMAQSDLPLFSYLRRTQFCEAVRQSAEMARHTRRHACNILLTFINEPFPKEWGEKAHRQLRRDELEGFFAAAAFAVRVEDPYVAIKPVDGDYDPPAGIGLPDIHLYTLWYNGHGMSFGELHRGAFPATKAGWCFGCGEYGAEGLDFPDLMRRRYPAHWLSAPGEPEENWSPARIFRAQSGIMHGYFFDAQNTLDDWCRASQEHQRWATQAMTEAFRRMDRMVSCAIHLFIDAWPAGWMKTIVDCERRPKPAFFALRDAYAPVLLSLRSDRRFVWAGEEMETEAWICNDTTEVIDRAEIRWQLEDTAGRTLASGYGPASVRACTPVCVGLIPWSAPGDVTDRSKLTLRAALRRDGQVLADAALEFEVLAKTDINSPEICLLDNAGSPAARLAGDLSGEALACTLSPNDTFALASHWPADPAVADAWLDWVRSGGTLMLYDLPEGDLPLPGGTVEIKTSGFNSALFAARDTGHPWVDGFAPDDFKCWHHAALDRIEPFLPRMILAPECWRPILRSVYANWGTTAVPALAAAELPLGNGRILLCQLQLDGRLATNPPAAIFARRMLE